MSPSTTRRAWHLWRSGRVSAATPPRPFWRAPSRGLIRAGPERQLERLPVARVSARLSDAGRPPLADAARYPRTNGKEERFIQNAPPRALCASMVRGGAAGCDEVPAGGPTVEW